ncbi:hypothetical protein CSB08_00460 [Candidatus Gracilibacteria bacterium]|nr:MAG: hypothetical protein CSB08_00460 [Candidatus Gracilibacteria bacterium]PIE85314.1 MAG: hypothetical protein CSA08_02810 [Candidatus Gracilibacteria bacterium]
MIKSIFSQFAGLVSEWNTQNNLAKKTLESYDVKKQTEIIKDKVVDELNKLNDFNSFKKSKHSQYLLSVYPDLKPVDYIEFGGQKFFLSPIIKSGKYSQVVGFVEVDGKLESRLFYKSYSDGGWRSTPGQRFDMAYSKGEDIRGYSYTVTTKVVDALGVKIDSIEQKIEGNILPYFGKVLKFAETDILHPINSDSMISEVKAYDDNGVLDRFSVYKPGYLGRNLETVDDIILVIKQLNNKYPDGFIPDFNKRLIKNSYFINHTIAGKTKIEVFEGTLNGRKILWEMAQRIDRPQEVWISNIRLLDSKLSSFGVDSEFINCGILNNKPFEYATQLPFSFLPRENGYVNITSILAYLEPIKRYKKYLEENRKQ